MDTKKSINVPKESTIIEQVQLLLEFDAANSYQKCIDIVYLNGIRINEKTRKLFMNHYQPNINISEILKLTDIIVYQYYLEKEDTIVTVNDLETLCKYPSIDYIPGDHYSSYSQDRYFSISKLIEIYIKKGIIPTVTCLEYRLLYGDWDSCDILFANKVHPDNRCLNLACFHHKIDYIEMILNSKILPDKISFHSIFQNKSLGSYYYNSPDYYASQSVIDSESIKEEVKFHKETFGIVELFFKFGYQLTYDDLLKLMRKSIKIDNYQKFGIVLDDRYLEMAWALSYFPYEYDVIPKIELLYFLAGLKYPYDDYYASEGNKYTGREPWDKIENLLKKYYKSGLKPDQKLLELLSKNKNAITTINRIMRKYNVKPTLQAIINMAKANEETFMILLLEKYKGKSNTVKDNDNTQDFNELCKLIKEEETFPKIKEYITKNNLKPNTKVLEVACLSKNKKIAEYLMNDHNIIPNATCIKAIVIHSKTKHSGALLDFYEFENETIDTQSLKETKESIVPSKYNARDRTLYFCRLNNPLEKFQSIKDDFQELDITLKKSYPSVNISVDKNGDITQVKYKNSQSLNQTHILVNMTIDILYNMETIASNKKILSNILTVHWEMIANRGRYYNKNRNTGGHTIYVQPGNYPFSKKEICNSKCHIKDYSFEQYIKHAPKDEKKETTKTVNVSPFYLTMDTFKSKLVPILGDKIKID